MSSALTAHPCGVQCICRAQDGAFVVGGHERVVEVVHIRELAAPFKEAVRSRRRLLRRESQVADDVLGERFGQVSRRNDCSCPG